MNSKNEKVVIVDYELGNLFSVQHACNFIGLETVISSDKDLIKSAKAIILPGVGAFGDAMENIRKLDLFEPLKEFVESGKPFLGVCLGMQLLFEESEEFGDKKGLGIIKGKIKKFPKEFEGKKMRIPQIGWNHINEPEKSGWDNSPLKEINDNELMYFVHSYYAEPIENSEILSTTNYNGFNYCSSVRRNNVFAMQFHPEKSGAKGIQIYNNFKNIIK